MSMLVIAGIGLSHLVDDRAVKPIMTACSKNPTNDAVLVMLDQLKDLATVTELFAIGVRPWRWNTAEADAL